MECCFSVFEIEGSSGCSSNSKAIVQYQPTLHSVLIILWAQKLDEMSGSTSMALDVRSMGQGFDMISDDMEDDIEPIIPIDCAQAEQLRDVQAVLQLSQQPWNGDQVDDNTTAKKCLLTAFDTAASTNVLSTSTLPPELVKKTMSLPLSVSTASKTTRVVMSQVR